MGLPPIPVGQDAQRKDVYETILYREGGRVTECSHSNVHIITSDGVFKTAPTDNLILPGIARAHLIKACGELGIPVDETPFSVEEMMNADEVLISSSTAPIRVCNIIDGKAVGSKNSEIVGKLQKYVMDDYISKTNI